MNKAINNGLVKAAVYGMHFQQYDKEVETPWVPEKKDHLPKHLVNAVLTAFTLQLVSLFDDGLDEAWNQRKPGTTAPMLGVKVAEFVRQGWFLDPDAVQQLVKLRNRLAHEQDAFATWEDWDSAYRLIQRELGQLGITYRA